MKHRLSMLCTVVLLCGAAHALEAQGSAGALDYTIYGPDWCWQKRDINVMAVLENSGAEDVEVSVSITLPEAETPPFSVDVDHPLEQSLTIAPGETRRIAFTQIAVSADAPRAVYAMTLRVAVAGAAPVQIPYPVRTVRGAAVSPGKWALYVPVAFTAAWSVLMFVALCRMGGKRAWLETAAPLGEDGA